MQLFLTLRIAFVALLALGQATEGDDLARQICSTYKRFGKLYCVSLHEHLSDLYVNLFTKVTTLSYVICAEGGHELEKTVDTGMWCEAKHPLDADGENAVVPSSNPDIWALPYMRPGINIDEQDNATHADLRQKYLGRGPGGKGSGHESEL